jgi:hypothetical protein
MGGRGQNAKESQEEYIKTQGTDDQLLKKSATQTISECMTQENFDKPINEFSDDDLNDKVNLSKVRARCNSRWSGSVHVFR